MKAKVISIGSSSGIILSKELLTMLNVKKGDSLSIVETPRGIELSAFDQDFEEQMAAAREVMSKYRNALRELAK